MITDPNGRPLISTRGRPTRTASPISPPELQEGDREHKKTVEQENLRDIDPRAPAFTITANRVLMCGDESCNQPITDQEPFLILSIPDRGAVFMHMICMGINTDPDNLQDVHWVAHVRRRFIDSFMRDKLYGRRTSSV